MNIQQPNIDLKNNFELFLEGVKVDFLSITISEMEGGIPAASITFPSSSGILRILPGTIVQIFGYHFREDKTFLLFEGEVTALNFQRSDSMRVVVIKAISLLGALIKAKFVPSDAIITKELKDNLGIQGSNIIINNPGGSGSSIGQKSIQEMEDIKERKSTTISGKTKDIAITSVYGLTDDFNKLLAENQPGGKGDFIPMFQQFNLNFEYNDLFFGLRSLAYKFGRSIFASPNPERLNKVKVDLFLEALNAVKSGISDAFKERSYSLMEVLTEFQRYLHYNFISPATYTACMPFYISGDKKSWEPMRMAYFPQLECGPPALCNIFFPEQVQSFTYSREMMNEPTRIVGKATVPFVVSKTQTVDWTPSFAYPQLEFDTEKAVGNFTLEETYRGINYKVITYDNVQSNLITRSKTQTGNGLKTTNGGKITEEDMEGDLGRIIRPYAYMDWLSLRYQDRLTSLNTEWNPYRMIGLPALMLDTDGVSIVGIINSIETNLTATGDSTTRVTLRGTRIIHDGEFEQTEFSSNNTSISKGFERFVIHDLTYDGMMSNNELLYYPELYNFINVGKDVYTYIMHGMLNKNHGFYKLKDQNIFTEYKNSLDPSSSSRQEHSRLDNSILHYIINTDGTFKIDIPENYNIYEEVRNTYLLYKSVSNLRKEYEAKQYKIKDNEKSYEMNQVYDYIYAVNRRNIITKQDYFNFIGSRGENRKLETEDAHDATIIFQGGAQELRQEIMNRSNEEYQTIVTTSTADTSTARANLKRAIAKYDQLSLNGKLKTDTDIEDQYPMGTQYSLAHFKKYFIPERLQAIQDAKQLVTDLTKSLNEIEQQTPEETASIVTKNKEMYKPYNMTRRMHVRLAFKDTSIISIDNNKSKLMVN